MSSETKKETQNVSKSVEAPPVPLVNDGSFLERFKAMQKQAEEEKARNAQPKKSNFPGKKFVNKQPNGQAESSGTPAEPASTSSSAPASTSAKRPSEDMKPTDQQKVSEADAAAEAKKSKADEYKETMKKYKDADCRGYTRGSALVK